MRIRTACLSKQAFSAFDHALGLKSLLGIGGDYERVISENLHLIESKKIYRFQDRFSLNYFILLLPGSTETFFFIGPFLSDSVTENQIMDIAENVHLPADRLNILKEFLLSVPVVSDQGCLFNMLIAFGELLWGGTGEFEFVHLNLADTGFPSPDFTGGEYTENADITLRMQRMDMRYQYENELMRLVSKGLFHRAEHMLSQFSEVTVEQRASDPVRNLKNYAVICNTLLRKASEQGGVHPFELNRISSDYAHFIENASSPHKIKHIMLQMLKTYCRAVRKQCIRSYSLPVQRAILYIENNLSGNLNLPSIAGEQNLNPCYLSDLFHRETGRTIVQFITEKRTELAAELLKDPSVSIQSVSQQCGMTDVNYFSKLFKKAYGVPPKKFQSGTLYPAHKLSPK